MNQLLVEKKKFKTNVTFQIRDWNLSVAYQILASGYWPKNRGNVHIKVKVTPKTFHK